MAKSSTSFAPGQSGNPVGRPKGRHTALQALDAIGLDGAEEVLRSVVDAASTGDMKAADILLRRLWPERKGRPVLMNLPAVMTPSDIVAALGAVSASVAAGELTPDEGVAVARILEAQRRAAETVDLEKRITALEQSRDSAS